jgi:hypothetical protein
MVPLPLISVMSYDPFPVPFSLAAIRLSLPGVLAGPTHDQDSLRARHHFHRSGEMLVMPVPPDHQLARGRALDRPRR